MLIKIDISKDVPVVVSELYVGVSMIERSVELDEKLQYALGHTILGAYHARSGLAEPEEALKHFERALELNGGKALTTQVLFAKTYYCLKSDKAAYEKNLHEVLDAGDILPEQRLANSIAKRRARRYLSKKRESDCGF